MAGFFLSNIGRPTLRVKLLGWDVSRDKGFIEGEISLIMHLLLQL
jgi:hypothetical protein